MNRQATLSDVAKAAGASPMTVSRVVTGSGYVSSELRRRVERVIARLGYSPNRLARSLKGAPSKTIGVLLPDLSNPFSTDLARGIEQTLLERGYCPFVVCAGIGSGLESSAIQAFIDHRVAGAVFATRSPELDRNTILEMARKRFPVVVVGPEFEEEGIDHVVASYRNGGREATRHLIDSGRKRIAFLGSNLEDANPVPRFRGYLDALKEHGIAPNKTLTAAPARRSAWSTHEDGYECMHRLMDLRKPPDAVFAQNDYAAMGAMRALCERGVSVPDDIAIVGFDNVACGAYTAPPLSTVSHFGFEQGKRAGALLVERVESGKRREPREERFDCELIVRQSSAAAALAA
ncbi:MAG: LacI family DNA-binding transcriptional regulator [Acidobacteriota bacterium]|nr:LacI family DNA-binding transcriptional regulator [Acidobacteriota bacterium]